MSTLIPTYPAFGNTETPRPPVHYALVVRMDNGDRFSIRRAPDGAITFSARKTGGSLTITAAEYRDMIRGLAQEAGMLCYDGTGEAAN